MGKQVEPQLAGFFLSWPTEQCITLVKKMIKSQSKKSVSLELDLDYIFVRSMMGGSRLI